MSLAPQPSEWTRDDWLRWRLDGIGGSDVAALCALSRFASPMSVFVDKCELGAPREPTEAMLWGQLLEEPIAREVEARTELYVVGAQTLAVDDAHPWRRCTLDGLVSDSPNALLRYYDDELDGGEFLLGTCQIKCSSDYGWDEIPEEYLVQVQWELGVTGLPRAWLAVLHQGRRLVIYTIDADPRVFELLCRIVDRFWHDHVLTRTPPPADGSEATTAALKAAFPDSDGELVELPTDVLEAAKAWPAAKQRVKDAELDVERIENELRVALGSASVGGVLGDDELIPLVTWKSQKAGARIDTARLKAERPDIAAEYTPDAGTTRVLRSTKQLRELLNEPDDDPEGANP